MRQDGVVKFAIVSVNSDLQGSWEMEGAYTRLAGVGRYVRVGVVVLEMFMVDFYFHHRLRMVSL